MNRNVGQLLKELREKKHLSQNQLAEKLHISRSVIAKYETGEREPSFNNLIILSKYFKIPITDLIPIYEDSIESNNTKDVLNYLLKQNKSFRIIVLTLIIILLVTTVSALVYINVLNHVSTKVYKVTASKHNILIREGLLVKTRDKVYFSLVNSIENKEVTKLKFYFLDNNEKVYIVETSEINNLKFYADLKDDEHFVLHNYENFFKNSFLEVCYKNNTSESIKLNYEFDYTNNSLEGDIEEISTEQILVEKTTESIKGEYAFRNYQKSELYDIAMPFIEDNNYGVFNVKLDGINYELSVINKVLSILYEYKNKKYNLVYSYMSNKETLKLDETTTSTKKLYYINLTDDECDGKRCMDVSNHIKMIKVLIEKTKK